MSPSPSDVGRRAIGVPDKAVIKGELRGRTVQKRKRPPTRLLQVEGRFTSWWRVKDSNLRRLSRRIYSPP